jgi:hypothetical protein
MVSVIEDDTALGWLYYISTVLSKWGFKLCFYSEVFIFVFKDTEDKQLPTPYFCTDLMHKCAKC